ncbi:MAG: bifunctional 5,10-methylenetetrahydrofolate dehydrogenase/5,10-methenyltetrahydrofolate cyclohydrolase [Alphaproteobacteria bacterium]|jgi:methylenetetrahydrofolate dehydrogenase (NADP+)/methenyltetrahydrofolate cyclohydrolase|nr:bifunctional 5,10-methylenetetrahydrofolate dehydrogenase/5,10-methenyltetrahydrofolate cyclohydrolase [Alphaproteobacteria bacterium]
MSKIINGKEIAENILKELKEEVKAAETQISKSPQLSIILVGDNSESKIYVKNKIARAKDVGIEASFYELPEDCSEGDLEFLIDSLNTDEDVNGIIVQLPLPKHLNEDKILNKITPEKDVDGFTDTNQDALFKGSSDFIFPATPLAVIELINRFDNDINGKKSCVIGKSKIVGKPLAKMLENLGADVTTIDRDTKNPEDISSSADLLIVAAGSKHLVKENWVKEDALIIDIGITKDNDGKIYGDVDFDNVVDKARAITPVPGGVGPMTIAMLLTNTVKAFEKQNKLI